MATHDINGNSSQPWSSALGRTLPLLELTVPDASIVAYSIAKPAVHSCKGASRSRLFSFILSFSSYLIVLYRLLKLPRTTVAPSAAYGGDRSVVAARLRRFDIALLPYAYSTYQ